MGHETDFTVSDFVADLRAPTPTAAAELAVPSILDLKKQLLTDTNRLQQTLQYRLNSYKDRLRSLNQAYAFKYPIHLTRQKEQDLDRHVQRLNRTIKTYFRQKQTELNQSQKRLFTFKPMSMVLQQSQELSYKKNRLNQAIKKK